MLGRAAAETENKLVVDTLVANPTMLETSQPLFSAAHGNLLDGLPSALIEHNLDAARRAFRAMRDLDGETLIAATPRFLLVGPELETNAQRILSELYAATTAEVNPFAGAFDLIVEPRLQGRDWYMFAAPAQLPVLEIAYLADAPGPQLATRDGWDTLAMEFRVLLDFGVGAVDWRGAVKIEAS
jgi:hypothetical protein